MLGPETTALEKTSFMEDFVDSTTLLGSILYLPTCPGGKFDCNMAPLRLVEIYPRPRTVSATLNKWLISIILLLGLRAMSLLG